MSNRVKENAIKDMAIRADLDSIGKHKRIASFADLKLDHKKEVVDLMLKAYGRVITELTNEGKDITVPFICKIKIKRKNAIFLKEKRRLANMKNENYDKLPYNDKVELNRLAYKAAMEKIKDLPSLVKKKPVAFKFKIIKKNSS